jgi:hypothetical protein
MTEFFLTQIYFHTAASMIVIGLCWGLSKTLKIQAQLGFLYLFSLPIKMGFFYYFFPYLFESSLSLSIQQKGFILFPLTFFLFFEVLMVAKILNQKPKADI